jgi:hypothetical protein
MTRRPIAYRRIAEAAAASAPSVVVQWLPNGKRIAHEWVALNPTRVDNRPGSFKINLRTGAWADFATGDRGGDLISLAAYIFRLEQSEAALRIASMIGIDPNE